MLRVPNRIGQTAHLIPVDNDSLCNLFVYPEVDYRPVSIPYPAKFPASPQLDLSRPSANSMSASLRPSSFPTQPILRRQSSDSKRPRLGESELEVSHWNGDTCVCAHSKSERFDPDVAVQQTDIPLLQSLLSYMKKRGYLRVCDIKSLFPDQESVVIKLANLLCTLQSLQFCIPSDISSSEEGVYVMKKEDREGDVSEIISKDLGDKEKEELATVKRRIEVLEQMTLLWELVECFSCRDSVTIKDVIRELLKIG